MLSKKSYILLFFAFVSVLLSSFTSASTIEFYRREVLVGTRTAEVEDTVMFTRMPGRIQLPLSFDIENFERSATFRNYTCEAVRKKYGTLVTCDLPEGEQGRLSLTFSTTDLVKRLDSYYFFKDSFTVPFNTSKIVYTSNLQSGLVLLPENESRPLPSFSPRSGNKGSDGRRIFVYWTREDVEQGDGITTSLTFEEADKQAEETTSLYVFIAGSLLIIILLFIASRIKERPESGMPQALKEDESKVIEIIKDSGGEIKQRRIVDSTEFSKAKVSRLIKDLVERGLIEKEKVGRSNRIHLEDLNQSKG